MKPIDRPHELKRYYQDTDVAEDYMRRRTGQPLNGVLHRRQVQFLNEHWRRAHRVLSWRSPVAPAV